MFLPPGRVQFLLFCSLFFLFLLLNTLLLVLFLVLNTLISRRLGTRKCATSLGAANFAHTMQHSYFFTAAAAAAPSGFAKGDWPFIELQYVSA